MPLVAVDLGRQPKSVKCSRYEALGGGGNMPLVAVDLGRQPKSVKCNPHLEVAVLGLVMLDER